MEELLAFRGTDRFEVISPLGEGGMGAVYHVADRERGTRVALKTVGHGKGDALWRFKNEFRSLQEIDHENLVTLGELFEHQGQWFFTMELISGVDFLSYVRPDRDASIGYEATMADPSSTKEGLSTHRLATREVGFDEVRLRRSLAQLCSALFALHEQGHLHRDIKPANVLVDDGGRLVVIDFGLVVDMTGEDPLGQVVGTAAFMAPEQAFAQSVGPGTDWYAVGITLYEALTGNVPFEGSPAHVLMRKQEEVPPPPSSICPEVPEDLDRLCVDLLQIDPAKRPTGAEVLRRLHVGTTPASSRRFTSSRGNAFVGRGRELDALRLAVARAREGTQSIVVVAGPSGMGKSRLVRQLDAELEAEGDVLVLRGRCYEQESVPFKAFDGVMDQLSRWLQRRTDLELDQLLPPLAGQLGVAFPVLRRVRAIDEGALPPTPDPIERRRLLFASVRELFARLSVDKRIVLTIDDIQWSDDASRQLLESVTRKPDPPPCAIVLTERTVADAGSVVASWFEGTRLLTIGALSEAESLSLAEAQLGERAKELGDLLPRLVAHASGHPIFLETLIRHAADGDDEALDLDLDGVLLQQLDHLDAASRSLLEVVCLAGAPIDRAVAGRAADVSAGALPQRLRSLRVARLVRASDSTHQGAVEAYHGRIREAVLVVLEEGKRRAHHRELALAFEESGAQPERIAQHYEQGGHAERATIFLLRAAHRASRAYAFLQAARLLERALHLGTMASKKAQQVRVRLGHALANAGQGEEAAAAYESCLAGAGDAERVDLKRRIAEQLLTAGLYRRGVDAGREVMHDLDISFPNTGGAAFRRLAWLRIRLGVRGLGFTEKSADDLSPNDLARIDACWFLSRGFAAHDVILAQVLQSQALLYALNAGEPLRIAKGYCYEYLSRAIDGPESLQKELLEQARLIADVSDDPNVRAALAFAEGMGAHTAACHFLTSAPLLEEASTILRDQCTDVAWEQSLADEQRLLAYYWLGRWRDMARDCPELCAHADHVGNKYWVNRFAGSYLSFVRELEDDVVASRRLVERGEAALPADASAVQRFGQLWCATRLDLYEGQWASAVDRIESWRADFLASFVLKVPLVAFTHQFDIGRVFLAAAQNDASNRAAHLKRVRKAAKHLSKVKVPFAAGIAAVLRGAMATVEGKQEDALGMFEIANASLREHGLSAIAAAVDRRRGELMGGERGRALTAGADAWFREQGVRNTGKMVQMLVPGQAATEEGFQPFSSPR